MTSRISKPLLLFAGDTDTQGQQVMNFLRLCLCVHENWLVTQACLALLNPEKWVDVSQGYKYKQCICAELKQLTDSNWKATEGRK